MTDIDKQKLEENQAKNDQAEKELDEELNEALEGEGDSIEPGGEEPKKPEEKPEEEEEEESEDESEEEPEEGESKEGDEEEPEEESKEEKKEEEEKPQEKVERPKKFIPLPKYQEEKKAWQEDKKNLDEAKKTIEDLKKINDKDQTKAEEDEELKALADEFDTPIKFVQDLMGILKKGQKIEPETIVEKKDAEEEPANKEATQDQIVENFGKEFDAFTPELKKRYPDASPEQLEEARKAMDEFAHSEEYSNYKLGDITKLNKKDFDDILGTSPNNPGVEGGKAGKRGVNQITSSSFKADADGNYDFDSLHKMEAGDKKETLIDGLSIEAWDAYVQDLDTQTELKVAKNDGRIVALK